MLLVLALLLCLPVQALAQPPLCPPQPRLIEVEGQGEVALAPTVGEATLSVESTAQTAAKALGQVSAATERVLEALKRKAAAEDRITTEGYDLFPLYEYEKGKARREATLVGYRARSRLSLKVAGPKRLGEMLDVAVGAGATGVSGLGFSNPALGDARRQAAALALKDARRLAEHLGAEAGVRAGRLLSVSAVPEMGPRPVRFRGAVATPEAAPPVEPGELQVRATVVAVYDIEEVPRAK